MASLVRRSRRVVRLSLFRPPHAVLLFGGLTLLSNWLWFGAGLFLGRALGWVLTAAALAGFVFAVAALIRRQHQLGGLVLFVLAVVGLPTLVLVTFRLSTGVPLLMHDGAYQTEVAMKALLRGQDPYGLDYSQTSMRLWHWYVSEPPHPSLFHYLYYPLTFLFPLPAYLAATAVHLPFDIRFVLALFELIAAAAVWRLPWRWEWRYVVTVALFLNPFFYLAQGRNDILFLAPITIGVLAWARGRPVLGAWGFGLALGFKPFAAFFIPLVVAALARDPTSRFPVRRRLGLGLAGLLLPAALTMIPFFLWAPGAFWADTVGFVAGTDPRSFPIQGYGLSALLLAVHLLPGPYARFPFGILQAAVALPLMLWSLRRVWRRPTLARILQGGTLTLAAFLFCGRFLNDNYIADLLFLAVLAGAARRGESFTKSAQVPAVRDLAA